MYKRILLLSLILCLSLLSKADFCWKSFEKDTTVAKAIFVGKVVKIEKDHFWSNGYPKTIFTLEVIESFKGLHQGVGYISLIGPIRGCCNVHFEKDSTFLVFAYASCDYSRILWTNDCSNTDLLSREKVNYLRLGKSIKHNAKPEELEYFNMEEIKIDSLLKNIDDLKLQVISAQNDKSTFKKYLIILASLVCLISALIVTMIIRKRKDKRNANNSYKS